MRSVGAALVKLIVTATSGLVSFTTNVIRPVKVTCEFSPVQEGTGDPSPDNVRPISGWTGCEIAQTGYNLLNLGVVEATPGAYVDNKRILEPYKYYLGFHSTSIAYYYRDYVTDFSVNGQSCSFTLSKYAIGITFLVKGGTRIKGTLTGTNVALGFTSFFDKEWNVVSGAWNIQNGINVPTNAVYAMARVDAPTKDQLSELTGFTIAYETGNVEMQPFDGETIPINWQSEAGTVYGGTVTLNEDGSADVVANKAKITYVGNASESWSKFGSGSASAFAMKHPLSNFINTDGAIIADYLVTIGKDASWGSYDNWVSWANPNVLVTGIKSITTVAAWKAYLAENPLTIVYNLRSSLSYHLDNVGQLQSFLGTNNIWHNMNGSITAEYYKKQ